MTTEQEACLVEDMAPDEAAEELGNTPSICRKCYVHPAVLDAYERGRLREALGPRADEDAVLAFLRGLAQ